MVDSVRANAVIFIDFENIRRIISGGYKVNIANLSFFNKLHEYLATDYRVANTIVYDNFEQETGLQKMLKPKGYECRPSSCNGKNAADIELTVDIIRTLYKNPYIESYIIITSDRDVVPVLKELRRESKLSHLISSMIHFNKDTIAFTDKHTYLEEIFGAFVAFEEDKAINHRDVLLKSLAYKVSGLFYNSMIYKRSIRREAISLTGYVNVLQNMMTYESSLILDALKLAGQLGLIQIYEDSKKGLCIRDGPAMNKLKDHQGGNT